MRSRCPVVGPPNAAVVDVVDRLPRLWIVDPLGPVEADGIVEEPSHPVPEPALRVNTVGDRERRAADELSPVVGDDIRVADRDAVRAIGEADRECPHVERGVT